MPKCVSSLLSFHLTVQQLFGSMPVWGSQLQITVLTLASWNTKGVFKGLTEFLGGSESMQPEALPELQHWWLRWGPWCGHHRTEVPVLLLVDESFLVGSLHCCLCKPSISAMLHQCPPWWILQGPSFFIYPLLKQFSVWMLLMGEAQFTPGVTWGGKFLASLPGSWDSEGRKFLKWERSIKKCCLTTKYDKVLHTSKKGILSCLWIPCCCKTGCLSSRAVPYRVWFEWPQKDSWPDAT